MASTKKKVGIALAVSLPAVVTLGFLLLSTASIEAAQARIDRNPEPPSSRWLQLASADVCYRTWRPEVAAAGYRRFYERYPGDPRKPGALLRYAQSLEASGRSADAVDIYQKYILEYPELEGRSDAEQGINRIRLCRKE